MGPALPLFAFRISYVVIDKRQILRYNDEVNDSACGLSGPRAKSERFDSKTRKVQVITSWTRTVGYPSS